MLVLADGVGDAHGLVVVVGPTTPLAPVAPLAPVDAVEPVAPLEPVALLEPVAPLDPVEPVDPREPVAPGEPAPKLLAGIAHCGAEKSVATLQLTCSAGSPNSAHDEVLQKHPQPAGAGSYSPNAQHLIDALASGHDDTSVQSDAGGVAPGAHAQNVPRAKHFVALQVASRAAPFFTALWLICALAFEYSPKSAPANSSRAGEHGLLGDDVA